VIELLRLLHRDLTLIYRHIRDEHGIPLIGEWTAEALIELHKKLHEVES